MKKNDEDGTTPSDDLELLVQKLRWLRLPGMAKLVASILEQAAKENLSTTDVVHRLCDEEKLSRIKSAVDRRLRDARFPEINTVDAFNFDFDPARKKLRARYLALHDLTWRAARIPLSRSTATWLKMRSAIVALGRKTFMFVQSEEAGKELALLYSLVVSCTRLGVNPVDYLADVLDRIDKTPDDGMRELLPDRWKPPPKPALTTDFVA